MGGSGKEATEVIGRGLWALQVGSLLGQFWLWRGSGRQLESKYTRDTCGHVRFEAWAAFSGARR